MLINCVQIRPVRADLFHEVRQTGLTTLMFTFRNFANAPKIVNAKPVSVVVCIIPKLYNKQKKANDN